MSQSPEFDPGPQRGAALVASYKKQPRAKKQPLLWFVLVALLMSVAVAAIWFQLTLARARLQREVAEWVVKFGGTVVYEYQVRESDQSVRPGAKLPGPAWLRRRYGVDFVDSVYGVALDSMQVRDLAPLTRLSNLRLLRLYPKWIFVNGGQLEVVRNWEFQKQLRSIAPVAKLENLKYLYIEGTHIKDLTPLSGLKNLRELELKEVPVTDITPLASIKSLRKLKLHVNAREEQILRLASELSECEIEIE